MFTSILAFALGFLAAAFLALLVAPAIWRRAVALTRKRVEASVPLTMNEIQADKDRLRAEFAMSTRRLEMSVQSFREKASEQIIETNRNRDELKRVAADRDEARRTIEALEAQGTDLAAALATHEEDVARLSGKLAEAERRLEEQGRELAQANRLLDETSLNASNRQIDVVARETEVEKLATELTVLRNQRRDQEKRARELSASSKSAEEALKSEKRRTAELEARLERMSSDLPVRDASLERREREVARLRDEIKQLTDSESELAEQMTGLQSQNLKLEAELADMSIRMRAMAEDRARGGEVEKVRQRLDAERQRLEERLTLLSRENRTLRQTVSDLESTSAEDWNGERQENAALRERINNLAAEMVHLTMTLEGPGSPIDAALDREPAPAVAPAPKSIAERVRELQKTANPYA